MQAVANRQAAKGTDLFGEITSIEVGETIPFSDEGVDAFFMEIPRIMLDDLAQSVRGMRREIRQGAEAKVNRPTQVKKDFFGDVAWIFELNKSPTPVTFDTVCSIAQLDAEAIRGLIAKEFSAQIRQFFAAYAAVEPADAARVARMLHSYINLAH
jgi:hypothetical protein